MQTLYKALWALRERLCVYTPYHAPAPSGSMHRLHSFGRCGRKKKNPESDVWGWRWVTMEFHCGCKVVQRACHVCPSVYLNYNTLRKRRLFCGILLQKAIYLFIYSLKMLRGSAKYKKSVFILLLCIRASRLMQITTRLKSIPFKKNKILNNIIQYSVLMMMWWLYDVG